MGYQEVYNFWFQELTTKEWWIKDEKLDHKIFDRFEHIHNKAIAGELYHWRETPEGRLSEIIVLDQFSRNMYRNSPEAFSSDPLALILAQEMVARGDDQKIDENFRSFCYMPYMHSESKAIHKIAMQLFDQPSMRGNLDFEIKHKEIIDKYGRYPHRNKILNRPSTPEEIEFLKTPGSFF